MRNKAMFLLEWVTYYRTIGFDHLLILTNDCEDGTDAMFDVLHEMGEVTHIRNELSEGQAPQVEGLKTALTHDIVRSSDWMFHCDADEFLNITSGTGQVAEFITQYDHTDCFALAWRPFGNNGLSEWREGNSKFFHRNNRNDIQDTSILRHLPQINALKARYLDNPELAGLHHRVYDWFQTLKDKVLTPDQVNAWTRAPESRAK